MKVKYKVVKEDRTSAFIGRDSHYCLKYKLWKIIKAEKTLGIFCFKTRTFAEKFILQLKNRKNYLQDRLDYENYKIIRVQPLERGKNPKEICRFPRDLTNFY